MKFEQELFVMDTTDPLHIDTDQMNIKVRLTHLLLAGQLRFFDEDVLERSLDYIRLHAFGQLFTFEDI